MEQLSESNLRPFMKQVVTASNEKFKQEKLKKSGSKVAFVLKSVCVLHVFLFTFEAVFSHSHSMFSHSMLGTASGFAINHNSNHVSTTLRSILASVLIFRTEG